jgi:hypothetical protein
MVYHNLVTAGFAVSCALMLQVGIGVFGDMMFSTNKAKAVGYVFKSPANTTVAAIAHK